MDVARVLQLLSEMYPNRAQAILRENLQNSIDSGARNVWINTDSRSGVATFTDDGAGIPLAKMHESAYFGVVWTTKGGTPLIGGKGIGRLTNIAAARRVTVCDNDGRGEASYFWYPDGSHENAAGVTPMGHHGLSLQLEGLEADIARDIDSKAEGVVSDYFDSYLRTGLQVWLNLQRLQPKQFRGKKRSFLLKSGGLLELFWSPSGQPPADQGIALKCRQVRVRGPVKLGIASDEWRNVAGVLNFDHLALTTNRDDFIDSPDFRSAVEEAAGRVRSFLARHENAKQRQLDKMAERYTKAALHALKELGIELSLFGPGGAGPGFDVGQSGLRSESSEQRREGGAGASQTGRESHRAGSSPGFHLIPKDFSTDDQLRPFLNEMSVHRGSDVFVNLTHPACPGNRHARSHYIWTCCFAEIVRWGSLGTNEQLDRDRLVEAYRGWLRSWNPDLSRFTPGSD